MTTTTNETAKADPNTLDMGRGFTLDIDNHTRVRLERIFDKFQHAEWPAARNEVEALVMELTAWLKFVNGDRQRISRNANEFIADAERLARAAVDEYERNQTIYRGTVDLARALLAKLAAAKPHPTTHNQ